MQMNHLIERVVLMQERADVLRSEERAFRMKLFLHIRCCSHWKTAGRSYGRNGVDDAGSWRHGKVRE